MNIYIYNITLVQSHESNIKSSTTNIGIPDEISIHALTLHPMQPFYTQSFIGISPFHAIESYINYYYITDNFTFIIDQRIIY